VALTAVFAGGNLNPGLREDRANRWVIAALMVIGLLNAICPLIQTASNSGPSARCDPLAWRCFVRPRRRFGFGRSMCSATASAVLVAIQPGHTLVSGGIYRVIRHPSYLGLLVNSLGWALAFRSGIGLLLIVPMILPIVVRINAEEALLRSQFGDEYDAYCARTGAAHSRALLELVA